MKNGFTILMSSSLSLLFGGTWGSLACLLDTATGIITGSALGFLCFYGLMNQTWDRTPVVQSRRFNDNPY